VSGRRILVINGHPDPASERFAAALAGAYVRGASHAGRQVRRIDVGALDFPLIATAGEFEEGAPPLAILEAQAAIRWADHLVFVFPLWLGGAPARLKAFVEQAFRYGFALRPGGVGPRGMLGGRTARIIVTMGMPSLLFRWGFGAAGARSLGRGVLWLSGVWPVRYLLLGGVDGSAPRRQAWLERVVALGAAGV
jgi:putative NADPH-quinone reductase